MKRLFVFYLSMMGLFTACIEGGVVVPPPSTPTRIGSTSYEAFVNFNALASPPLSSVSYSAIVSTSSTTISQSLTSSSFQFTDPFIDAAMRGLTQ